MAQKTRVELQAQIDALLADNNVGAITPLNVRTVEGDNIDSNFNKSTDTLDDIASGVTNVQYPATDKAKVDNVPADTITELLDKFSKSIDDSDDITEGIVNLFLTVLERAKLGNVPNDTNAELSDKVTGAASATNNFVVVFDGATGKVIKVPNADVNFNGQRIEGLTTLDARRNGVSVDSARIAILNDVSAISNFLSTDPVMYVHNADPSTGSGAGIHLRVGTQDFSIRLDENGFLNFENDEVLIFQMRGDGSVSTGGDFDLNGNTLQNSDIDNTNTINSIAIANYVIIGGDIGGTGATPVINNDAITNAKLANIATNRIKGRSSSGTGDVEDLTAAEVKTMLNLPTNTVSDLGDKVNKSGDTLTGALLGDQSIRGHRPPTTVITASVTLSTTQQNQFQYIDPTAENIVLTLDTATTNLAAIGVEFDFMVQNTTNSVTISVGERVVSYVQGIGRVTGEAEITVTGATVFQIKKTANREFAIIGGGMSL